MNSKRPLLLRCIPHVLRIPKFHSTCPTYSAILFHLQIRILTFYSTYPVYSDILFHILIHIYRLFIPRVLCIPTIHSTFKYVYSDFLFNPSYVFRNCIPPINTYIPTYIPHFSFLSIPAIYSTVKYVYSDFSFHMSYVFRHIIPPLNTHSDFSFYVSYVFLHCIPPINTYIPTFTCPTCSDILFHEFCVFRHFIPPLNSYSDFSFHVSQIESII